MPADTGVTTGDVDVSLDGGATWTNAGHPAICFLQQSTIAIPQAAGHSDVRVRFHYAGQAPRCGSWTT